MSGGKIIPIIATEAVKARDDRHADFKTLLEYFTEIVQQLDKRITKLECGSGGGTTPATSA